MSKMTVVTMVSNPTPGYLQNFKKRLLPGGGRQPFLFFSGMLSGLHVDRSRVLIRAGRRGPTRTG
jgi:hypothetical protein